MILTNCFSRMVPLQTEVWSSQRKRAVEAAQFRYLLLVIIVSARSVPTFSWFGRLY